MNKSIILIFLLLIVTEAFSIDLKSFDYSKADSIAINFDPIFNSSQKLAIKLTKDLATEHEKFRVLFRWVTDHITYDYRQKSTDPKQVLKKRGAVCSGYANLLQQLCKYAGIECEIVNGYAKVDEVNHIGKIDKPDHAWNSVKLYNKWYLVDATWAAGFVNKRRFTKKFNEFYYLTNPDQFIYRHFPVAKKWTLSTKKINLKEFGKMPIYKDLFFINDLSIANKIDGEIKNNLELHLKSELPIFSVSYYFENKKEFINVDFEEDDDIYKIKIEFDKLDKGGLLIYVNREAVIGFDKK
jgi:hypothetical protein